MGLYYQEFGSDTAPTIVFLHGGGVSARCFESVEIVKFCKMIEESIQPQ